MVQLSGWLCGEGTGPLDPSALHSPPPPLLARGLGDGLRGGVLEVGGGGWELVRVRGDHGGHRVGRGGRCVHRRVRGGGGSGTEGPAAAPLTHWPPAQESMRGLSNVHRRFVEGCLFAMQ